MSVRITVDGQEFSGQEGQTIAGIMIAGGKREWRTAAGEPRGVFCGIGVCHDCIVAVNDVSGVRACQRAAADGDVVEGESR